MEKHPYQCFYSLLTSHTGHLLCCREDELRLLTHIWTYSLLPALMKWNVQGSNTALLASRHVVQSIICSLLSYPDMWASFLLSFVHYHKTLASVNDIELLRRGQIFRCSNNETVVVDIICEFIVFIKPLLRKVHNLCIQSKSE